MSNDKKQKQTESEWYSQREAVILRRKENDVDNDAAPTYRKTLPLDANTASTRTTGRIPNFLLAGAQKAGTTAVAEYLFRTLQPHVCHAKRRPKLPYTKKETHFFDIYYDQEGMDYYFDIFKDCPASIPVILDATPNYLSLAPRIFEFYKEQGLEKSIKIMFILREPVSREISWYQHIVRELHDGTVADWVQQCVNPDGGIKSFEEFFDELIVPTTQSSQMSNFGMYAHWLKEWFDLFPRNNILVTSYDDFQGNQTEYLLRMHSFVELAIPQTTGPLEAPISNSKHLKMETPISCAIQHRVAELFQRPNQELYDLLEQYPGPSMEKRPFTRFVFQCKDKKE